MSMVELRNVRKSFGPVDVIHGVDLDVEEGEFVVFVGPSGCGKSTLLRLISGLEVLTDGELSIDGRSMRGISPSARQVAMVFQSYALYPHMTVADNMSFALRMEGVPRRQRRAQVEEIARTLRLEDLLDRKPRELSGGQRQRVAIGRCIVRKPKVFLFDEPLSNLDAELRVQMRVELTNLHRDLGVTSIYVTHDQIEAMTMADRIVVLRDGVIEQVGTPTELYERPGNRFVAGFIGSPKMNFLSGELRELTAAGIGVAIDGQLGDPLRFDCPTDGMQVGDQVSIGIRPEHFVEPDESGARLRTTVGSVEKLGDEAYLYAPDNPAGPLIVRKQGRAAASRAYDDIELGLDAGLCHVFDRNGVAVANGGTTNR